jgi:hypothetical protein
MAGPGKEFDSLPPLRFLELNLLEECVDVLHQALYDLFQARILRAFESPEDFRGDVVFSGETRFDNRSWHDDFLPRKNQGRASKPTAAFKL